jgi:hypothetical protein
MMNVTYAVTEERYALGNESRTSYGIVAYANAEQDGTATIVASVHDITSDKQHLTKLVDDCNRFELSTVHLHDVVEDFLSD